MGEEMEGRAADGGETEAAGGAGGSVEEKDEEMG